MVQHSVEAMIFILLTMQAPTPTRMLIWVTVTCRWLGTNIAPAIRETYLPENTSFSPMKWKYFTRRTRTDNIWLILFCARLFIGTLSRGFLRFVSRTKNTPRTSREGNLIIFSREEQTIVSYWRFLHKTKEKLENISPMFSSCNHFHPSDPLPNKLNQSLRELIE